MPHATRVGLTLVAVIVAAVVASAQSSIPQTKLPNPYRLVENWPTLPASMNGGRWGELIRADVDPRGNIWVFHRCFNTEPAGAATCVGRSEPPILQFNPAGRLLSSFGGGLFAFPHGFTVDADGNIWASDANANETVLGISARGPNGVLRGHQVFKFSPSGKLLMTLGKAGVAGNGLDTFDRPTGIAIAPNGDILVSDGHGTNDRVVKFSKDGRFIKTWGRHGSGPGEFDQPHDISLGGSRGWIYVADRSNNRVQIFDQEGKFIADWKQFSRISGLHIAATDTLYAIDSESSPERNPGWRKGLRIGSAKTGEVLYYVPQHDSAVPSGGGGFGAMGEGVTVDAAGNIYGGEVGSVTGITKFVPRLLPR